MAIRRITRAVGPIALVAATLVACTTASGPPAPPTVRVERTSVSTAVSSSGSLTAVTEQNLGFLKGGQLKTVEVAVGQKVAEGDVLATVDDTALRRLLEQQQGQLAAQQAALNRLVNATTVAGAENTTDQAGEIVDATEGQTDATVAADKAAVDRAEKQLDFDEDTRDDVEDQLDQAEDACEASGGTPSSASVDTSGLLSSVLGDNDSDESDSDSDSDEESAKERRERLEAALRAAGSLAGSLVSSSAAGANSACTQVATAQSALTQAERQVEASKTALDTARNRVQVDEAAGRVQVANARQGLVTAQNNLDSARTDRPSLIAQQRGLVAVAQAAVAAAQKDVDDTVLRAPADGTVAAVNGATGEVLAPSAGTTPLAPGSEGAIPGAGSSANGSAGVVTRPGGTQFLVLDNVDSFEVVVPFEESDAVRLAPDQRVDVRFDAIPDLTLPGTVVAVSPSASALSGVISYYATVALSQSDPRLRNGPDGAGVGGHGRAARRDRGAERGDPPSGRPHAGDGAAVRRSAGRRHHARRGRRHLHAGALGAGRGRRGRPAHRPLGETRKREAGSCRARTTGPRRERPRPSRAVRRPTARPPTLRPPVAVLRPRSRRAGAASSGRRGSRCWSSWWWR